MRVVGHGGGGWGGVGFRGLVGGGGLWGVGGGGGRRTGAGARSTVVCGSFGLGGRGSCGWGDARPAGAVAGAVVCQLDLLGEAGGGLWARRVGWGPLRGPWGVLAVLVVRGLPGVGPVLASAGAAVLVCWTVGVAPWGACELWLARGLGQVTTRGRVAALPPGLGAGRPGRQRAGAGVWPQQGHQGARVGSPRRGRLRPAAPGPGRAPPVRSSRLGPPGPVGEANPQTGSPQGSPTRPRRPG